VGSFELINEAAMTHLKRSIIAIVSIKVSIVVLAAFLVFGPSQRPQVDRNVLIRHLLSDSEITK
jgi:hypothetical protein